MRKFRSWRDYRDFVWFVKHKNRFFYNRKTQEFLQTVLETGKNRIKIIRKGTYLWRAQLGNNGDYFNPRLFSKNRIVPLADKATEGRANPKGIPYLYLSDKKETAMAEVRPLKGSHISLGLFKLSKDIKIIDCTHKGKHKIIPFGEEGSPEEREIVCTVMVLT